MSLVHGAPIPVTVPTWQAPFVQLWPAPQVVPQPPQFAPSVIVSTQLAPHRVCVPGQRGIMHDPDTHDVPPVHALPHVPQFIMSVCRFGQLVPQRVRPAAQSHVPLTQCSSVAHALPQLPQFAESVSTSVHPLGHAVSEPRHWQLAPTH